jgi:hypothetical protein
MPRVVFSVRPAAIESRRPLPNSLMPDNLAKQMTLQEFAICWRSDNTVTTAPAFSKLDG